MTVTLELRPDTEAAARAAAQAEGVGVEDFLKTLLEGQLLKPRQDLVGADSREAALSRIQSGFYAGRLSPSDEFAARKEEEKALEERHWNRK